MHTRKSLWLTVNACLLLVAIVLLAFGRSLTCYFLADDFGIARYAHDILSGHTELLVHNWIGNFNSVPGMAVYRPWQIISWLSDVALWQGNAAGYYATNLLYYCADTILLFLVGRQLTRQWNQARSLAASFAAAALFAVNPLHCESVSWMIGRVDIECCFYYLIGLYSYLQYVACSKRIWITLGTAGFWLGMFVKEMAIGLPVVAFAISFLGINAPWAAKTVAPRSRLFAAFRQAAPIWLSTILYFVIRYLALGTLAGGYTGAIGDGQAGSAIARWLDPDTYTRVFLPFAASLFHPDNLWRALLSSSYAGMLAVFGVKVLRKELPVKLTAFCAIWVATCALPIYKLWGLGMDLEGSRFCFFLTMSVSASVAVLLMAPAHATALGATGFAEGAAPQANRGIGNRWQPISALGDTGTIAVIAMAIAAFCLYKGCLRTNATWIHAGKEVKALLGSAADLARASAPDRKIIVLGIPKRNVSAHMIYNGATFRLGLCPPVSPFDYSNQFITFDPIFYGPGEFINSARLKAYMGRQDIEGPFVWRAQQNKFLPCVFGNSAITDDHVHGDQTQLQLTAATTASAAQAYSEGHCNVQVADGMFKLTQTLPGDGLQFNDLKIDPRAFDFIQFDFKGPPRAEHLTFAASWTGENSDSHTALPHAYSLLPEKQRADGFATVRIPVSHYWRWFTEGTITSLYLTVPPLSNVDIKNISVVAGTHLRPTIDAINCQDDGSGVFYTSDAPSFHINARAVPKAAKILIECSKPDYFFDQLDVLKQADAVGNQFIVDSTDFDGTLPGTFLPKHRYCEIRARALNESGQPIGEYCEPLIINCG